MRICKDCKYFLLPDHGDAEYARCAHPSSVYIDNVTGVQKSVYCSTLRNSMGACKPEGILFEPAER